MNFKVPEFFLRQKPAPAVTVARERAVLDRPLGLAGRRVAHVRPIPDAPALRHAVFGKGWLKFAVCAGAEGSGEQDRTEKGAGFISPALSPPPRRRKSPSAESCRPVITGFSAPRQTVSAEASGDPTDIKTEENFD